MEKHKRLKKIVNILVVFMVCLNTHASIISDNDGAAFVTKAEFDAMKESFSKQITAYNKSIENKIDGSIAAYLSGIQVNKQYVISNAWGETKYCTIVENKTINDITPTKFGLNWNCTGLSLSSNAGSGSTYSTIDITRNNSDNIEIFLIKQVGTNLWNFDQYTKEATIKLIHSGVATINAKWTNYTSIVTDKVVWRSSYQNSGTSQRWDKQYGETGGPADNKTVWNCIWGQDDAIKFSDSALNWRYIRRYKTDSLAENNFKAGVQTWSYDNEYSKKTVDSIKTSSFMIIPPEEHSGNVSWVVVEPTSGNKFVNNRFQASEPPSCYDKTITKWGFADPEKADVVVNGYIGGYGNGFGGSVKVKNVPINSWYTRSNAISAWETNGSASNIWWEWWYNPDTVDITKIKNTMTKLKSEDRKADDDSLCAGVLVLHNENKKYSKCEFKIDASNLTKKFKIGLSQNVFGTNNSESNRDNDNSLKFKINGTNYVGWSDLQDPGIITIDVDCGDNEYIYLTLKYDTAGNTCKHEIFSIEREVRVVEA